MTRVWRTYLALILALILGLTSHSLAMARGMTGPAGMVELCTGSGPVSVYVDADGQPVDRPHHCPDCALHLLAGVIPPDCAPHPVEAPARTPVCYGAHLSEEGPRIAASARGPPCMV